MRYAWIAFTLIFLDQGIKWVMHAFDIGGEVLIDAGPVSLELLESDRLPTETIYATLTNSTTLVLLLALLTLHLLVSRWSTQSFFLSLTTKIGMQLASAGIISYVADTIFAGTIQSTLCLDFADLLAINAGIADLALLLGFALLGNPIDSRGMALWRKRLFALISKNSLRAASYLGVPSDRVVEVGTQVDI